MPNMSEYKFIKMPDGAELHTEIHEAASPIWLICTHGIGEHMGRHKYISELFGHHFNILRYDLRGHGRSQGQRGHIDSFTQFIEDLHQIILFLKDRYKMKRYVLFGHSMGALITAGYMRHLVDDAFYPEKVFLNAPAVGFPGLLGQGLKRLPLRATAGLAKLPFTIKLGGLVDLNFLSHDPFVKDHYLEDDLNILKPHSKLLLEMVHYSFDLFKNPLNLKCSGHVSVGSDEHVIDPRALKNYFTKVERNFELKVFDGAYHEIHNEVEKFRKPYFEFLKNTFLECLYQKGEVPLES
ncbi:MAG: alpha/beta fold hydrolase [Halobacteriovoraceae bacterium]|nr:alpha/beta fold hydrolase [Halobacteriovoraceae bacterium]